MNKDLKSPKSGKAYPKRPSVRFENQIIDQNNPFPFSMGNQADFSLPSKMRSSTFHQNETQIREQKEMDNLKANWQHIIDASSKNPQSEYKYDKLNDNQKDVLEDSEARKLLSDYEKQMANGDFRSIDEDTISVISQKIPMLNK